MTVLIPEKANQAQIKEVLDKLKKPKKSFKAEKYFGKIKWGQNALEFQRELRGE